MGAGVGGLCAMVHGLRLFGSMNTMVVEEKHVDVCVRGAIGDCRR